MFVALLSLTAGFVEAAFLVVVTRAAFAITDGEPRFDLLGGAEVTIEQGVLLALVLVLGRLALGLSGAWSTARLISGVTASLRREMAEAWLGASWAAQHDERTGQLQELLVSFTQRGSMLVGSLLLAITSGFSLLAMLALAVVVDPVAASVVFLAVSALAQLLRPFRSAVRRSGKRSTSSSMSYASTLSEVSQLGLEMHIFRVQGPIGSRIDDVIREQAAVNRQLDFLRQLVPTVYAGLAYLAVVLSIGIAAAADTADLRSVGAVMLVMLRSLSYGQNLQSSLTNYVSMTPFLEELDQRISAYRAASEPSGDTPVPAVTSIVAEDVSFAYHADQMILDRLNFAISKGEVIGIVGPSGSGKSTLVQILLGLRHPSSGRVTIDGREIRELDREQWARRVTFVPQQPRLIAGTIAENIRFYRSDVDLPAIQRAARLAHIDRDIAGWHEGYDREVGDNGSRLSGGQQQRVCIARALVERPDVLILDEPTSSLDAISEMLVRETLDGLRGKTTVLIVAHRLSTLVICDRIMVLQAGKILAFDSPTNLDLVDGFYAEALRASAIGE